MKDAILYYARCNAKINAELSALLADKLKKPFDVVLTGYFFKTLGDILRHLYVSDMNWMVAFLAARDFGIDLEAEVGQVPAYGTKPFAGFEEYRAARTKLDAVIQKLADRLAEEDFPRKISRVNHKGERMEVILWKALVHFFNHQTHHRGQVSCVLDSLNIENNYSNMIFIE